MKRDLGEEAVSPGGTAGTSLHSPPQGTVGVFLIQKGICSIFFSIYSGRHEGEFQ